MARVGWPRNDTDDHGKGDGVVLVLNEVVLVLSAAVLGLVARWFLAKAQRREVEKG
jgi:flagellar basal body-associated protein FliL